MAEEDAAIAVVVRAATASTTTAVKTSDGDSTYGQSVTFTATVSTASGTPTGSVQFEIDGAKVGSPVTLAGKTATYSTSTVHAGSHAITAVYGGGGSFAASTAAAIQQNVEQAVPSVSWATPAAITYGTPISNTQLNASANVPGAFQYFVPVGTILPAGSEPLAVQFTPTDATDYTTAIVDVNLVIKKANPVIAWATPAPITYGTALSGTQLKATANVPGSFSYSVSPGTVLPAGVQSLVVAFTPADDTDYNTVLGSVNLVINKATPTLTWPAPASIAYGTALGAAQLDATASVPGTFNYSAAAGTILSAGSHTLSVTFTPTNSTDYATVSANVNLVVSKATLALTWPTPAAIFYGTALSATQLDATANVPGSFSYNFSLGTVFHPGTHALSATFSPTDTTDYAAATASVNLVVAKAAPALNWPAPAAITYGVALSAAQLNASANVPGTFSYNFPAGAVLHPGAQTLAVTFTPTDGTDYITASASVGLVVNKATPVLTWAVPAPIIYGTAVSGTQLNAGASVPGSFSYSVPPGKILSAGLQPLVVAFTPTDATDYASGVTATVDLLVNRATPALTWATPAPITYGAPLTGTQLNASANVPGAFSYNLPLGKVLSAGTQPLSASFTPADSTDYAPAAAYVNLIVNKATPALSWATPAPIFYGTALSGTQLNAIANVPGNFNYNFPAGTLFHPGTQPLSATFTPTDTADYLSATASVTLVVAKSAPTLNWPTPAPVSYGVALSGTQLNANANVPGTFSYNFAAGAVFHPGTLSLSVTFTPADPIDYTTAAASVNFVVNQATPVLSWAVPAPIVYGTAVTATQLDAVANVPGSISYSVAAGMVLSAGSQKLTANFTPTDTTDYAAATASVNLAVAQVTPTLTWSAPAPISYGTALTATQLNATSSVPGTFSYNYPAGTVFNPGTPQLLVTFNPTDSTDYTTAAANVTLVVNKATPALTWTVPAPITFGTPLGAAQLNASTPVPGTFSYSARAGTAPGVGTQALSVVFTPANPLDYTSAFATVNLVVTQAKPVITWPVPAPITSGAPLGATQLNATANVAGTFVYSPSAATNLGAGVQSLSVNFVPADAVDYTTATASVNLIVSSPALPTPVITWPTPASITYGIPLTATQLNAAANVAGSFTYSVAAGAVLAAGTHTLSATFSPSNPAQYNPATASVNLVVAQATPTITWPAPSPIFYGAALSDTQLNASANTDGTFAYSVGAGAVLHPGTQAISVIFNPADSTDYTTAAATVDLVVAKWAATITWPVPAPIVYGQALDATELNAGADIPGTFAYSVPAGAVLGAGVQTLSSIFTPADTTDYATASASVSLAVAPATPVITWPTPAPLTYGDAVGATQLNAAATIPGAFAYSVSAGTVFHAGAQSLSVTFTPADAADFSTVTADVNLTVNPATLNVTADDQRRAPGGANPPLDYTLSGFVNGDTAAVVSGKAILTTPADAASASGAYPITVDPHTLAAADYTLNPVHGTLLITVGEAPSTIVSSLGHVVAPAGEIAGDPIKATIPVVIADDGDNLAGAYTVNVFANTENALDGGEVLISTVSKKLSLHHGKHAIVTQHLDSLPANLPAGDYYLIAEVVDPTGQISVVASPQTVTVQAPTSASGGLVVSAAPMRTATLHAGQSGMIAVTVTNNGDADAVGALHLTLSQSTDGATPGMTLATLTKKTKIAHHQHKSFAVRFKTASLPAGTYLPLLSVSLGEQVATAVGSSFTVV
jgi:hypothetical protein